MKVVLLDGGLGRVIAATPAIQVLAKREQIAVITPWVEVFENNLDVFRVYHQGYQYLFDDVIKGNEFISPEPYFLKEYYDGGIHLSQAFAQLLGVEIPSTTPVLHFSRQEIEFGKKTIESVREKTTKPVVMLQVSGASTQENDPTMRSIRSGLLDRILKEIEASFINFSHTPVNHPAVKNIQNQPARVFMGITSQADYCIGIDSCMMHVAAATGRVGTFFWGSTDPKQLGYERFQNIQRAGYPKRHQPMRFAHDTRVNAGAMDYTREEIDAAIDAIKAHLEKCQWPNKTEKLPSKVVNAEVVPEKECKSA